MTSFERVHSDTKLTNKLSDILDLRKLKQRRWLQQHEMTLLKDTIIFVLFFIDLVIIMLRIRLKKGSILQCEEHFKA